MTTPAAKSEFVLNEDISPPHQWHAQIVTVEEFGSELQRRRDRAGLTQEELAIASGLSVDRIRQLESGRDRSVPGRGNTIRLAVAVAWDVDAALAMLGHDLLNEKEREYSEPGNVYLTQVKRCWPLLTVEMQRAIANVAEAAAQKPKRVSRQRKPLDRRGHPLQPGSGEIHPPRDNMTTESDNGA